MKFWNFLKGKAAKLLSKVGIGKLGKKKDKVDDKHIKNMDSEIAPEPFSMNGESHTLTFENREIYMASEKGSLTSKLTRFKKYVSKKPDSDGFEGKGSEILKEINDLQIRNERVKKDLTNAKNRVDGPEKEKRIDKAEVDFSGLSKDIQNFGDRFKLYDLIASSKKTKYKPEKVEFYAGEKQITIKYFYDVEVNGKNATRTFEGSFRLNGDFVEQTTTGYNLVTKESGSRSHTASANQVDANEAIRHLKKNPEEQIEFNASHVLADQFLGSGYKIALNLITASGHYNKETMRGAEERLITALNRTEKIYKNRDIQNYITFDIKVTAKWKELVDNAITFELARLTPSIDKALLESMHKILARNVDPKLVQSVVYEVLLVKLNGTKDIRHNIRPIEIGIDEKLQKVLK